MKILIDLINYPSAGGSNYDWRYTMWVNICKYLSHWHSIHAVYQRGVTDKCPIQNHLKSNIKEFDYYICHTPYGNEQRMKRWNQYKNKKIPVTVYDHGWLPKSLVVDRDKLFGDSYYRNTIKNLVQECPSLEQAETLRLKLLSNHISKRQQPKIDPIPDVDYIFVPGQVLYDASVVNYSKIGLKELIKRVLEFAIAHNLHVVYKPHPGILDLPSHGKKELTSFCNNLLKSNSNFHVVNTSIFDLMTKARFTACVNSGSIIDNIVSLTPVYCCGDSFFANSGTVVYDPDVEQGLKMLYHQAYDPEYMKSQQLKMLWWLNENLIQEKMPVERQVQLLEKHSGVKLVSNNPIL